MEKMQCIRAFVEWNSKGIFNSKFVRDAIILDIIFSGGLYLMAGAAKVNSQLSVFKWISFMLCIFLIVMTPYCLINLKRKRAAICMYFALIMINLTLDFGGAGLFLAYFQNGHYLSGNKIQYYFISCFVMMFIGFLFNYCSIMKGKYITAKSPRGWYFYAMFGMLGMAASRLMGKLVNENINIEITVIAFVLASYLTLLTATNCFLKWYYILRYKGLIEEGSNG